MFLSIRFIIFLTSALSAHKITVPLDLTLSVNFRKISEIFLKFGEARFRELEREKIKKFSALKHQIIALGGGAFEDEANRSRLLENCTVIYLKASPGEIYKRIKQETHRPLLAKNFSVERIAKISNDRAGNYEKADFTIDTDNKTPYDVVKEILGVING